MDRAAQLGRSRDGGRRRRPALATLLALACMLAAVALGQTPPTEQPASTSPTPSATDLQGRLDKTNDPVPRLVLTEEIRRAEAKSEAAALRLREARAATAAAQEASELIALQLDVMRRAESVKSVTECSRLLRYIMGCQRDLGDIEESIQRAQAALAEEKRTCELLTEAVRHTEKAARDGSLEAIPALSTWDEHLRQRFTEAVTESLQLLDQQRQALASLDLAEQGRLAAAHKTESLLAHKQAQVNATKDRLFWQRQAVPYSLQTVKDAWKDLKSLAGWAEDFVLSVPGELPRVLGQATKRPFLWEFLGSCAILAGGLFLVIVVGNGVRSWLGGKMTRIEERATTWETRLALLGLRGVYGEVRYWFALTIAAGLWLMFVALQGAYFQGRVAAGPGGELGEGLSPWRAALALWFAYLVIGAWRLARRLVFESIVEQEGHAPLFPLPAEVARHLLRGLRLIATVGAAVLLFIAVLSALGYRPAFVSLLWTVLRVIILLSILWPIARRRTFERMLTAHHTLAARVVFRIVSYLYVPAVIAVLLLLVFSSVGYVALSRSIILAALETVIGLFVIGLIGGAALVWLRRREEKAQGLAEARPGLLVLVQALRLMRPVVHVGAALVAVCFVLKLLWFHYGTVVFSPHAPVFVRATATKAAAIMNGLMAWAVRPMYADSHLTPVRMVVALLVVVLIILAAGPVRRLLEQQVLKRTPLDIDTQYTLSAVVTYALAGVCGIVALHVSGIPLAGLGIFAGAIGLAVGFGMQAILSNFVSGIIMMIERHVKLGDCVKIGDELIGYVERINARSTTIATFDNYRVIIPNSEFIEKQVVNWSTQDPRLRIKVEVGVAYGSNTELAAMSLIKVAQENALVLKDPAPEVQFVEFGDSALRFELLVWVGDVHDYHKVISDLHFQIDREFRAKGVAIAFPQHDLHLRSVSPEALEALRAQGRNPSSG